MKWLSNFIMHQNHLELLSKHCFLGPPLEFLEWCLRSSISDKSSGGADAASQGAHLRSTGVVLSLIHI